MPDSNDTNTTNNDPNTTPSRAATAVNQQQYTSPGPPQYEPQTEESRTATSTAIAITIGQGQSHLMSPETQVLYSNGGVTWGEVCSECSRRLGPKVVRFVIVGGCVVATTSAVLSCKNGCPPY